MQNGIVVKYEQHRPVALDSKGQTLLAGEIASFLDLRLTNRSGDERVMRVPVSNEVLDFYLR